MDELELLKALGAELAPPAPRGMERARARLDALIAAELADGPATAPVRDRSRPRPGHERIPNPFDPPGTRGARPQRPGPYDDRGR